MEISQTCIILQFYHLFSLPVKSIAKAFGHLRLPVTRVTPAGLTIDERRIAGRVVLQSVQYRSLYGPRSNTL